MLFLAALASRECYFLSFYREEGFLLSSQLSLRLKSPFAKKLIIFN
jgi:hypothetical protein